MSATPDSPTPPPSSTTTAAADIRQYLDHAATSALTLKNLVTSTADSAVAAAGSGLCRLRSASLHTLQDAKGMAEYGKSQYKVYENQAIGKVKEGIAEAVAHPEIACAAAAGLGLVVLKRPRRFLIHRTRRIFVSEESLLSHAEAKVNELRQSINLVKNESKKLEERALKAEEEMQRGRMALAKEGREIRGELHFVGKIEKEARGLKDFLGELPRREASRYHSEVSGLISQVNKEKKVLSRTTAKIINYGIPL